MIPTRKTRDDKGDIQLTARDTLVLTWLGEQYAMRFDHIHALLNRYAGPGVSPQGLSVSAVRQVVARWHRAGWIEQRRLLAGEPPWLWLTREGLLAFALPYTPGPPALTRLRHLHAVTAVRLLIMPTQADALWVSERAIRAGTFHALGETSHTPDALLCTDTDTIAIEVELTHKKPADLHKIVHTLLASRDAQKFTHTYTHVRYYVTDPAIEKAVLLACDNQHIRHDALTVHRFNLHTLEGQDRSHTA